MTRMLVFLAVSFFISLASYAGEVSFDKTSHDFGPIAGGYYQPAQFMFTNNTDAPIAIINIQASRTVKLQYQRGYIRPGQSASISLKFESQTLGKFSETARVFLSNSDQPVVLKISGTMITAVECFPDKSNWEIREIRIIDALTKEVIPNAEAEFKLNFQKNIPIKKQSDGRYLAQLPIGMYDVEASAKGYLPLSTERHIRKTEPIIYIELIRNGQPQAEPVAEQVATPEPVAASEPVEDYGDSLLPSALYKQNNIVFLIDISLSMKKNGKMQQVQQSMHGLIDALRTTDSIGVVVYNNTAKTVASQLSGQDKSQLHRVVDSLVPAGLTNGVAGLQMAYQIASNSKNIDGNNQIILITDGEFSTTGQSEGELAKVISSYAEQSIKMSILSFGEDRDAIAGLKRIAKKGEGNYLDFSNLQAGNILLEEIKNQSIKQ